MTLDKAARARIAVQVKEVGRHGYLQVNGSPRMVGDFFCPHQPEGRARHLIRIEAPYGAKRFTRKVIEQTARAHLVSGCEEHLAPR